MRTLALSLLLFASASLASQQPAGVSLQDFATQAGAQLWTDPWRGVALLQTENRTLSVDFATGLGLGDGEQEFQLQPLAASASGPLLARADADRLRDWFRQTSGGGPPKPGPDPVVAEAPIRQDSHRRVQVIVLDAGHGGNDPGSIGRHEIDGKTVVLKEKDLTLAVVLETNRLLQEAFPDRTIVLTRATDTYPTLEERVRKAHAQKLGPHDSILFLSVHFNASLNAKARGLEFWYVPQEFEREVIAAHDVPESVFPVLNLMVDQEFKKESQDLAQDLAQGLAAELGDDQIQRGLKENPWFVVRMARMPAVLAELGFITNADEAKSLTEPSYLKQLAHGLYTGLASFIRTYEDVP
ncbi:MAG: N-acetylmuramoyl-L-alanine amidase [Spirochaetales bacterium]